jgi:flagellar motor component MotA
MSEFQPEQNRIKSTRTGKDRDVLNREKNYFEFYLSMKHQGNQQITIQNIITIEIKALESTKTQCFHSLPKSFSIRKSAK